MMQKPLAGVKRVALLSTYHENIGDDLIREGVGYQIQRAIGSTPEFLHIAKSNKLSRYLAANRLAFDPVQRMTEGRRRRTQFAGKLIAGTPGSRFFDKARRCDLFVIAGTPVFYFVGDRSFIENERIYSEDWPAEIFDKAIDREGAPPLVALGLGSIYEGDPEEVLREHPKAKDFIARFLRRARFVTARDAGTETLLCAACPDRSHVVHRSVCPSLWSREALGLEQADAPEARRAVVGFSLESTGWAAGANSEESRRRAADWTVEYFKQRRYDIAFVAHNELDLPVQGELAVRHGLPGPRKVDALGLLFEVANSRVVATWRVHGSVAGVMMGTPSILFRTDSRYQIGADAGAEILDDTKLDESELVSALDKACTETPEARAERVRASRLRLDAELDTLSRKFREALEAE